MDRQLARTPSLGSPSGPRITGTNVFGTATALARTLLGIDISAAVSACLAGAGLLTALNYGWQSVSTLLRDWFCSRVTIRPGDRLHQQVLDWISKHPVTQNSRHLVAQTILHGSMHIDHYPHPRLPIHPVHSIDHGKMKSTTPPIYTPAYGRVHFWHRGYYFIFSRGNSRRGITTTIKKLINSARHTDTEPITLECFSLSSAQLKQLIMDIMAFAADANKSTTTIRRSEGNIWMTWLIRPSRPMDTIYMDSNVKADILDDMREFLDAESPRFYARRGIPYRRGYLFHGQPGTSKTSLSFALAGEFGIDIHVVSLRDAGMTEQRLADLMATLPPRCIVLLEDVDSAGVKRDDGGQPTVEKREEAPISRKRLNADGTYSRGEGVTLSGLLNAIDGVASQEGRLLIMTTNNPENLDPALIRPGRVDHQVRFGNASHDHIHQIFTRMFTRDPEPANTSDAPSPDKTHLALDMDAGELDDMARRFSRALDEDVFTPAEIQGFLLTHRKEPAQALAKVGAWSRALKSAKAAGRNVVANGDEAVAVMGKSLPRDAWRPPASRSGGGEAAGVLGEAGLSMGSDG